MGRVQSAGVDNQFFHLFTKLEDVVYFVEKTGVNGRSVTAKRCKF